MTTADSPHRAERWTSAVRQRLGLGRLLPLGGPNDGSWIAERAATAVLRDAAAGSGAVIGTLRIAPVDEDGAPDPVVPGPPSALRPGPLRIEAAFSATARRPLPATADALRAALLTAADQRLGLVVESVDLTVTALLEEEPEPDAEPPADLRAARPDDVAGTAAAGVPGVVSLTHVLGSAVQHTEGHVRVELATSGNHRALDVARAVRAAVAESVEGPGTVAVLVTAVTDRN
uniref:Nucleopolyhedrovirus P10 family protein n=1 Tax=Streptomyces sp. NBC_01401 TaxID=2903854 RepID=A0AAU3GZD7_9ACTN